MNVPAAITNSNLGDLAHPLLQIIPWFFDALVTLGCPGLLHQTARPSL